MFHRDVRQDLLSVALAALIVTTGSTRVAAQAAPDTQAPPPPSEPVPPRKGNNGRLSLSSSVDVLSRYMFRGLPQDDRGLIAWPAVDVGLGLFEGDGAVKRVQMNVGLWNSLHSGPTGLGGPSGKMWYESDFYSSLALGLAAGVTLGATYTAYMSPNSSFGTVKEVAVSLSIDDSAKALPLAPYGLVAFEVDGQADGGTGAGTYMELGVKPTLPVATGRLALAVPLKIGLSLNDYYEGPSGSGTFGYLDGGILATVPLRGVPEAFGAWSLRGGASVVALGGSLRQLTDGRRVQFVGLFGIALTY
jgi:hypothetical protein